jgi:hypothetical protein
MEVAALASRRGKGESRQGEREIGFHTMESGFQAGENTFPLYGSLFVGSWCLREEGKVVELADRI